MVDDDGDLTGTWDGSRFWFLLLGEQQEILQVRGRWHRSLQLDQREVASLAVNDWNRERIWPKAYLREEEGVLALYSEVSADFEPGVTEPQLAQLLACGLGTGVQMFSSLEAVLPRDDAPPPDVPDNCGHADLQRRASPIVGRPSTTGPAGPPVPHASPAPPWLCSSLTAAAPVPRVAGRGAAHGERAARQRGVGDQVVRRRVRDRRRTTRSPGRGTSAAAGRQGEVHQAVVGGAPGDAVRRAVLAALAPRRRAPRRVRPTCARFSSCAMRSCRAVQPHEPLLHDRLGQLVGQVERRASRGAASTGT